MKRVAIVAGGVNKWGKRAATFRQLVQEAGKVCFDSNSNISNKDIQGFILATAYSERTAIQIHPASFMAQVLGVHPTKLYMRVENQCGSGTTALRTAWWAIASGYVDMVMCVGAEKLLIPSHDEIFFNASSATDKEWEGCFGMNPPSLFAMVAQAHMRKYGTTEEQLGKVALKNHAHATKTPYAHHYERYQKHGKVSLETIMCSKVVSSPLKLFDCCTNTDGAAAIILASEEKAKELTDKPVYLVGTGQVCLNGSWAAAHKDWSEWPALKLAAKQAYEMAGVKPEDIDLAEIHDCFSISEIIETEEFGWCKKGEGGKFVENGLSDYGGQIVINPRGGLIACGHPFGATGIAQAYEIFLQLRGEAGERQVKDAKIALNHNLSGLGEHHVIIYKSGVD